MITDINELKNHFNQVVEIECPECKEVYTIRIRKDRPHTYNTLVCPKCRRKQTNIKKYGKSCNLSVDIQNRSKKIWESQGDEIRKKIKETSLRKYGYDSPNKDPKKIKKAKDSLISNFGSLEEAYKYKYEQNKKTKLQKYGSETYHNKEQASQTLQKRHSEFEKTNDCTRYTKLIEKYGQGWKSLELPIIYDGRFRYVSNKYISIISKYSKEFHNVKSRSKLETELYEYIKTLTKEKIYRNKKTIIEDETQKYELDIYIPSLHLAFEFNGTYWHTEIIKGKYFHQIKTKLCYEHGIQLIHIFEFDWKANKDVIKEHIKELFDGKDCSKYNWVSLNDYDKYYLTEPEIIYNFKSKNINTVIYNEGIFKKITTT